MIYEDNIAPGMDKRAVVECDKPGCLAAEWMAEVGSYTAAGRMRHVGWQVAAELSSSEVGGRQVRGYAARCPEHAEAPTPAHEHTYLFNKTLDTDVCRWCGSRRP